MSGAAGIPGVHAGEEVNTVVRQHETKTELHGTGDD
jgi:hypothetical protein